MKTLIPPASSSLGFCKYLPSIAFAVCYCLHHHLITSSTKPIAMPTILPSLSSISQVHPLVTRLLGQNPGPMTLQGTNSYLVGQKDESRVLIDTTKYTHRLDAYLASLQNELSNSPPLSAIILTHWHLDHCQAVPAVLELIRQLNPASDPVPVLKHRGGPDLPFISFTPLSHNDLIPVGHSTDSFIRLRVVATPGHTDDHICLALERRIVADDGSDAIRLEALFTGDHILGHGSTVVHNLSTYLESLRLLRQIVTANDTLPQSKIDDSPPKSPFLLLPGHGEMIDQPLVKIDQYLANRLYRLRQILDFFTTQRASNSSNNDGWIEETDILAACYTDLAVTIDDNHKAKLLCSALINLRLSLFHLASCSDNVDWSSLNDLQSSNFDFPESLIARYYNTDTCRWLPITHQEFANDIESADQLVASQIDKSSLDLDDDVARIGSNTTTIPGQRLLQSNWQWKPSWMR